MSKAYTKEFLVNAFLSRYVSLPDREFEALEVMVNDFYDKVDKAKFRAYCCLDAEAIRKAKETGLC